LLPRDDHVAPLDDPWEMFEARIWPRRTRFLRLAEGAISSHKFARYAGGSGRRGWLAVGIVFQGGTLPRAEAAGLGSGARRRGAVLLVLCTMLTGIDVVPAIPVRFPVYGSERTPIVPKTLQPRSRASPWGCRDTAPVPEIAEPPRYRERPSRAGDRWHHVTEAADNSMMVSRV
jgi:hypothetical protein